MKRSHIFSIIFLVALFGITAFVVIQSNDMAAVISYIGTMQPGWLAACIALALLYVAMEGYMIWYLLHNLQVRVKLPQAVRWSFIGFFFSGITPSATGGQPAQLYYMRRAGVKISESTPVLMTVALLYKFVLVVIGASIAIFWGDGLAYYFGSYLWLYYLGLMLNVVLVAALLFVMLSPVVAEKITIGIEGLLIRIRILKPSPERRERLLKAVGEYRDVVAYFKNNKRKILIVTGFTFLQRFCLFILPWFVYMGLGLSGDNPITIITLQAAIYVAVDMLPLPGSVGITELMYAKVFAGIFSGGLLTASMCITRGVSFYLVLFVSLAVLVYSQFRDKSDKTLTAGRIEHKNDNQIHYKKETKESHRDETRNDMVS